jgi:predicted nucleic acid-binding protein
MPLADTLLRMAEAPRLYRPRWSHLIMDEVTRNLISKFGMPAEKARRREKELRRHFPEAWIEGFEDLIDGMSNDQGDRHVLAAAVHEKADVILTYNLRHFPPSSLTPWKMEVQGPSTFLRELYEMDQGLFVQKLDEQASAIRIPVERLLRSLAKNVPGFVQYFSDVQRLSLS